MRRIRRNGKLSPPCTWGYEGGTGQTGEDVIVIKVSGGLGNQMQQYALYRKFKEMGREVYLDLTWFSPENQRKAGARRGLELFFYPQVHFEEEPKEGLGFFYKKCANKAV